MMRREKLLLMMLLLVMVAALGMIAVYAAISIDEGTQIPTISEQKAAQIALNNVAGSVSEIERFALNGRESYGVDIISKNGNYEVAIDAQTGEVLKVEKETTVGKKEITLIEAQYTKEQAASIALSRIKGEVGDVDIEKINGIYVYEVEVTKNDKEYEVRVDLNTGEIISIEEEEKDPLPKPNSSVISQIEAKSIARNSLESRFRFDEIGTTTFNAERVYEIEFEDEDEEAIVLVSFSGKVLSVSIEEDD